jgi:DNA-binding NarL/FixJ family response regulator
MDLTKRCDPGYPVRQGRRSPDGKSSVSCPSAGRASGSATREHPLGLTWREREVLELICAGHTNAEIAGKLFISAKTAGHHVSAVLAKLGVPTRHAAAIRAVRLGLAGMPC